ncbi:hypothetical protein LCGC14_0663310 [marine sediment metagenome]|uniref:Uncharacterized protein n=1 Tax=marine sediment metagenome TaxID=412755 RepID=A0A0F9U1A7_9ZZZZ
MIRVRDRGAYWRARRAATEGRTCTACLVNDSEANWSCALGLCEACERARHRAGTCQRCARPMRAYQVEGNKRVTGCAHCHVEEILARGFSRTILLAPQGERERPILRKTMALKHPHPLRTLGGVGPFPGVLTATPDMWRTWR